MKPFFSIITPTHKRPESLLRAISSVKAQTFSNYEHIIVNNAKELIELNFDDSRIKLVNEKRSGANYARNTGIENAKGQFICFLDDDDLYLENHLNCLYDLIKKHNSKEALYRTFTRIEKQKGCFEDQPVVLLKEGESQIEHFMTILLFMACVCCHKNIFNKILFDPSIPVAQDYHMWVRILMHYPLIETPEITTIYNKTENSISSPSLQTYLNYISVFKSIFDYPMVRKEAKTKTRRNRLFLYHNWLLRSHYKELKFIDFIKLSFGAFTYNYTFLFQIGYIKLFLLFLLHKLTVFRYFKSF